jgi:hypothetical protein
VESELVHLRAGMGSRFKKRRLHLLLILGTACGALVLLLALTVSNTDDLDQHQQHQQQQQFLHSENSNKKNNRIIKATTRNDARPNNMNMVGGYSSTLDINLPEIINVVNFVRNELLFAIKSHIPGTTTTSSSGNDGTTSSATTLHNTIVLPQQIIEAVAAQQNDTNNTINIELRKVQRQVVAGMNYKLTLAINIMNNSNTISVSNKEDNENNTETTTSCLGILENVIIYKPLPHTGLSYNVVSWGNLLNCDTVLLIMDDERSSHVEERLEKT